MRLPNPWVAIPSLVVGAVIGLLAWLVTDVACQPGSCTFAAVVAGVGGLVAGTIGMAVVLVLVYRSLAEWREATSRGEDPPGPGCEV